MDQRPGDFLDVPSWNGFLTMDRTNGTSVIRFYPYIMGADDSASGTGDAGSGGDGGSGDGGDSGDGGTDNQGATGGDTSDGKTFTQKEVSDLVAREVAKAQRGKLDPKELGFDSGKDLKEYIDKAKNEAEASKTEAERKFDEEVAAATKRAEDSVLAEANRRVLKAEFLVAAKNADVQHPEDAYVIAQTLESWGEVTVDEKGTVSGLTEDFFKALKEEKPFLFSGEKKPPGSVGAGAKGEGDTKDRTAELREKYSALRQ